MSDGTPSTEEELRQLLDGGLLEEDHHTDLKRELGPTARANRDLAKDVAALAIDGGTIYIGVDEGKGAGTATLHPVELEGLRERIDQVARMRPNPPVPVRTVEVPTAEDPSRGYLVVVVSPTHDSPHMVDGRYWGRSDTTNYPLPDAEVVRLHQRRLVAEEAGEELVHAEFARDPWTTNSDRVAIEAHLFVVAQPLLPDAELLVRAVPERNVRRWLNQVVVRGPLGARSGADYDPDIGSTTTNFSARAHGAAVHTYCISPERDVRANGNSPAKESNLLDMEVWEDGGIRLYCGRASDTHDESVIFGTIVAGLADRVLLAAREVSRVSNYLGPWTVGVGLTGLRGRTSYQQSSFPPPPVATGFSEDQYVRVTRSSADELEKDRGTVAGRLLGRFLRTLGLAEDLPARFGDR